MYFKDFDRWNLVKKHINQTNLTTHIRAGEIRWTSFGVNIGSEIDGKGNSFTRPVLIIHVIGSHLALVVPMSTKLKSVPGYVPFIWKDTITSLCIHQVKIISQKRFLSRKGKISEIKLKAIKAEIVEFYFLN